MSQKIYTETAWVCILKSAFISINFFSVFRLKTIDIIVPRVKYNLKKLNIEQDNTSHVSFKSLNAIENLSKNDKQNPALGQFRSLINESCLTYKCLFCNESFNGAQAHNNAQSHFKDNHGGELDLLCCSCNKVFKVKHLVSNKWNHDCTLVSTVSSPEVQKLI